MKVLGELLRMDARFKPSCFIAEGMKVVAEEMNVPLVDLHARSRMAFEKLGEAGTTEFTANERERKGKQGEDRTHFTEAEARAVARLVAEALPDAAPALAPAVRQP